MKKKIVSMLLTSAMVVGLAACGGASSTESGVTNGQSSGQEGSGESAQAEGSGERQTITWSVIDVNAGVNAVGD